MNWYKNQADQWFLTCREPPEGSGENTDKVFIEGCCQLSIALIQFFHKGPKLFVNRSIKRGLYVQDVAK
jgi:hypothetical protein